MTDPQTVLDQQTTALRSLVDGLVADLAPQTTAKYRVGDGVLDCGSLQSVKVWPQRWGYSFAVDVEGADGRAAAEQTISTLERAGWMGRRNPASNGSIRADIQKDGALVSISAGTRSRRVVIQGYSACVNEDGSLDTRTVG